MKHIEVKHIKGMSKRRLAALNKMHATICDCWQIFVAENDGDETAAYTIFVGGIMCWLSALSESVCEHEDAEANKEGVNK